jgi:hypothetical protein
MMIASGEQKPLPLEESATIPSLGQTHAMMPAARRRRQNMVQQPQTPKLMYTVARSMHKPAKH